MAQKIALISLGCAKNLVNSEQMLCLLDDAGFELVSDPDGADAAIVNTCGFIDPAKMEAIDNILWLGSLKSEGKLGKIIVSGCLSERYREELFAEMPEIDALVGTGSFGDIVSVAKRVLGGDAQVASFGDIDAPVDETGRVVTTGPSWAYIRIAEGCDNHCAYCIIPSLRGKFRSRPIENVVAEARALAESGVRELIVVAQDITRYGTDLYGKRSLARLVRELCEIDELKWIRLHYLYPDEIDDELIDEISRQEKVLRYLDIPIQHISDKVLRLMNRRGTGAEIRTLFKKLREKLPGVVIRTSIITGLPGEGEEEFEELCEFLREFKLERAGVFPFSPEDGTKAAEMERVDPETAERRAELVREIQAEIMDAFDEDRFGDTVTVICEGYDDEADCLYGRSYAESPDVDGRILFAGQSEAGEFVTVRLTDEMDGELYGEEI